MFKEMFTEGKNGSIKPLDKPLTDSEIKKLKGFQKKLEDQEKGKKLRSRLRPGSMYWDEYENLLARASVPQKTFELITLAQAKKMGNVGSFARAVARVVKGRKMDIYDAKYLAKNKNLNKDDVAAFIEEYEDKIKKMYKSKKFVEMVKDNFAEEARESAPESSKAIGWAIQIALKGDLDSIIFTDTYKFHYEIEEETSSKSWTSYQGASMDTPITIATFEWDGKKHKTEIEGRTSGYWND